MRVYAVRILTTKVKSKHRKKNKKLGGFLFDFKKIIVYFYIKIMDEALKIIKEMNDELQVMDKKCFAKAYCQFSDFNKFNEFVDNCNFYRQITIEDIKNLNKNEILGENFEKILLEKTQPKICDVFDKIKVNLAKMFAYNLDNKRVVATIKADNFYYETIKKHLIQKEMFEDIVKLEKILKQ